MADIHYQNIVYYISFHVVRFIRSLLNAHWYLANKVRDTYNISGRCDQTYITHLRLFIGAQYRTTWPGPSPVKHTLLLIYGLIEKSGLATQ